MIAQDLNLSALSCAAHGGNRARHRRCASGTLNSDLPAIGAVGARYTAGAGGNVAGGLKRDRAVLSNGRISAMKSASWSYHIACSPRVKWAFAPLGYGTT